MANYLLANLAKAQAIVSQSFQAGELRYRNPVTYLEFKNNGEIMFPSHQLIRTREDRAIEANYFTRSARSLGTGGRTYNHTGVKGDSAVLTPSWTSYDDTFYFSLKQADLSVFSIEQQLANEIENLVANFAEGLETASANHLFNNRSQVNGASSEGAFDGVTFVYEIEDDKEKRAIQIGKTCMDINKWQGTYIAFCDSIAFNKFEFYANQGGGNSENLTFQYSNIKFVKSIDLDTLASGLGYTDGFWIMVQPGMIGSLDWIPKQNKEGVTTKVDDYLTFLNPVDGLNYAVHQYEERSDESGNNGSAQDTKTEVEISIDIALEHAGLSTSNETPMQAMAIIPAVVA